MTEDIETSVERPAPGLESPGMRLREVREGHDLTIGQVALSLHVDEALLKSLESDDYGRLGAPIFIKGHLRNYAKLLEIDAAEIIRAYEEHHQPVDPAISNRSPDGPVMEQRGSGIFLKWFGAVLLLAALLVLAGWWYYKQDTLGADMLGTPEPLERVADRQPEGQDPVAMPGADAAGSLQAGMPAADGGQPEAASAADGSDATATDADGSDATATNAAAPAGRTGGQQPLAAPTQEATGTAGAGNTRSSPAGSSVAEEPADQPLAPVTRPADTAATASRDQGGDAATQEILLEFSGESWVEVYDSDNRPLMYDLKAPGSRQQLEVQGPVRLFLGNAPQVSITVNGETFDVARYTRRDKTARFRIPPEG